MFVIGERTGQLGLTTDRQTHTYKPFEFQRFGRMKESSSPVEERCKIQLHEQFALVHSKKRKKSKNN